MLFTLDFLGKHIRRIHRLPDTSNGYLPEDCQHPTRTRDAGLLVYREIDGVFGLTDSGREFLARMSFSPQE